MTLQITGQKVNTRVLIHFLVDRPRSNLTRQGMVSHSVRGLWFRYWKPRGMLSTTLVVKDGVNIFGEGPRFPSCRLGDEVLEQGAELKRHLMKATSGAPVVPIGRLDKDSSGLLLLTTEASLISRVLRPRADLGGIAVEKEYHVRTHRLVKDNELECLRSGIDISVRGRIERTRPCQVLPLQPACH
jgi:16S rRNA U516 pseudouridylate synthase RsuA-like enzyme